MKKRFLTLGTFLLAICLLLCSCSQNENAEPPIQLSEIPEFTDKPYVEINGNEPFFTDEERSTSKSFEEYAELDALGRCGVTVACIGKDIMPTEDRGDISSIKPAGWKQAQYDGDYLYNRCHLIGHQLTGENDNERNLITGTRYFNIEGMLPFENMVADHIKETGNHVMYRVTPIYKNDYDLVASGVLMEAYSVEDEGDGICFNVYCYNVQPGVVINYSDGSSYKDGTTPLPPADETTDSTEGDNNGNTDTEKVSDGYNIPEEGGRYILNTGTKKIHKMPDEGQETRGCAPDKGADNYEERQMTKQEIIHLVDNESYKHCGTCKPFK